ncbi:hypothetical protein SDC9_150920 [bioreactor metagenome]|uniref:Uncharacterized protein n=1 Tax=bioreactor metagenome TaxID=1076179 RepID=A0A645ENU6_9ZZZZ
MANNGGEGICYGGGESDGRAAQGGGAGRHGVKAQHQHKGQDNRHIHHGQFAHADEAVDAGEHGHEDGNKPDPFVLHPFCQPGNDAADGACFIDDIEAAAHAEGQDDYPSGFHKPAGERL